MTDKKLDDQPMSGRFLVDLSELRRPVDDVFPEAHRQVAMATGFCASPPIGCGQKAMAFRDEISAREYKITSLCQHCQDRIFAEMAEDEEASEGDIDPNGPFGGEA